MDEPTSPHGAGGLVRVRLDLAYDGAGFSGWARQPGRRTVEETVATALATALRLPTGSVSLVVAGRTDTGVHASGQVAHVDVPREALAALGLERLPRRLAGLLPEDVVVRACTEAHPAFDARFSALRRHYEYRVTDAPPDPLRRRDTLAWTRPLDEFAMNAAAAGLVGAHDFLPFCRPREGTTTVRVLRALTVTRPEPPVVVVTAVGDAFCHHQVRAMVGALLAVGDGRRPVGWPADVLAAGVRDGAVTVAPPHGLTLVRVDY